MLCFPEQDLTKAELLAFARQFGEIRQPSKVTADPENPLIMLLSNKSVPGKPWSGYKAGQDWHSDYSFTDHPGMGTFVNSKEIPEIGGDTMFANMYMAYETLSPAMQKLLDGLEAVHAVERNKGNPHGEGMAAYFKENPPIVHPVVKVHRESGRKTLFISERIRKFVGMTEEETRPLLRFLTQHATRSEFCYRHVWRVNDVIMWDNRCLLHIALNDYDQTQIRHFIRCTHAGEPSGYPYTEEAEAAATAPSPAAAGARS